MPMNSCPSTMGRGCGKPPEYICRSEPQMAVAVIFKITSLFSLIIGSSTVSYVTDRGPWMRAAFIRVGRLVNLFFFLLPCRTLLLLHFVGQCPIGRYVAHGNLH